MLLFLYHVFVPLYSATTVCLMDMLMRKSNTKHSNALFRISVAIQTILFCFVLLLAEIS